MGVKDLWPKLEKAAAQINLSNFENKVVAVDLSGWIFESFRAEDLATKLNKPHLRTLFYRVRQLLKHGIKPVFVLDGQAPAIKLAEIQSRQSIISAGKHAEYRNSPDKQKVYKETEECCELLDCMGIPYIQATGEAEATCAMLNKHGFVDACITNDCDAFLFGARTVLRNFSGKEKEHELLCYSMDLIETKCGMDQQSLIAFALLVGCDYTKGVYGIGEDKACRLLTQLKDYYQESPLDRLMNWRKDKSLDELEDKKASMKKSSHCGVCDHVGNRVAHVKQGCPVCHTSAKCVAASRACNCEWHKQEEMYSQFKLEINIRKNALKDPNFPSEEVIKEFRNPSWNKPDKALWWNRPDMEQVQNFMQSKINWSRQETCEKMLPILTAWDMLINSHCISKPRGILRARIQNRVDCYEVEWDIIEGITDPQELVTLEQKDIFSKKFPEVAKKFEDLLEKTKETPKKWKTQGRSLKEKEEALKMNRKITDMFPMKKKTYIKRTDIIREGDAPVVSARKRLDFCSADSVENVPLPSRASPRKTKRPLRFGDMPANQPSIKRLFMPKDM